MLRDTTSDVLDGWIRTTNGVHRNRLRALQLGKSWLPEQAGSGLDRVYHALIEHLPNAGVDVHGIVAGSPEVSCASGNVVHPFASDRAPLSHRLRAVRRFVRSVDLSQFDVIATHFALYTFPVIDLVGSKPLIVHFHGPWAGEGKIEGESPAVVKAKEFLERAVYRRGTRFVVLSDSFKEVLCDIYGVPAEYVHKIPGGVDVERFETDLTCEQARDRLGWPRDRPIIVSVRRLARRMGLENLIDAIQILREYVPDILLFVAGKGPIEKELQAYIRDAGLQHHVKLLGYVSESDLPLVYRGANLSVVPSVALEGFGLVTVESLAAGTPALVTPIGGLPEVVSDLSETLLFESSKPPALADHLSRVLKGQVVLPPSHLCKSYARARFDWRIVARRVRWVYESAAA